MFIDDVLYRRCNHRCLGTIEVNRDFVACSALNWSAEDERPDSPEVHTCLKTSTALRYLAINKETNRVARQRARPMNTGAEHDFCADGRNLRSIENVEEPSGAGRRPPWVSSWELLGVSGTSPSLNLGLKVVNQVLMDVKVKVILRIACGIPRLLDERMNLQHILTSGSSKLQLRVADLSALALEGELDLSVGEYDVLQVHRSLPPTTESILAHLAATPTGGRGRRDRVSGDVRPAGSNVLACNDLSKLCRGPGEYGHF